MSALELLITFSCVTLRPQQFQLFQPIGGVRPILLPHRTVNRCVCSPFAFLAFTVNVYEPTFSKEPLNAPLSGFSVRPLGRSSEENFMGFSPLTPKRKWIGEPGRTPYRGVVLNLGSAGAAGVRIYLGIYFEVVLRPVLLSVNVAMTRTML